MEVFVPTGQTAPVTAPVTAVYDGEPDLPVVFWAFGSIWEDNGKSRVLVRDGVFVGMVATEGVHVVPADSFRGFRRYR